MGNEGTKGKVVPISPQKQAGWVPVEDEGYRLITDLPGGPFLVFPCSCGSPVEIESSSNLAHHRVRCENCGKHTAEVIGGELLDVLKLWNEIVN